MALEVKNMGLMRAELSNCVIKPLSCNGVMTFGGTVTQTSDVFDLRAATATGQKFTWAKFVYVGTKAGTAGVAAITITPTTGATSAAATAIAAYPVSVPGGTVSTGSLTTTAAGQVSASYDIDLVNSGVLEFLKFLVTFSTGTASDTITGQGFLILGGARELPVTDAANLTTL
jgi:hypothetical protein